MRASVRDAFLLQAGCLIVASERLLLATACDSLAVLPFATADGLGAMYGKNADRHYSEAQPVAALPRMTHPPGTTITLDSGLKIPQVATTFAHAGSRPNWAHPYGGYSEGVNEFGVGIGNEHFHSHGLPTDDGAAPQAEFTDLTRLVLERTKTAADGVSLLTQLISQYGQTCKSCPVLANYNSMFMVTDPTSVYSVMSVGHEWAWKEIKAGDPALNGTGVWTISNCLFTGATHLSAGAITTARKYLGYRGTAAAFDFGRVYGTTVCDAGQVRQVRSQAFMRDLAADHKLTKADLMLTLSDHEHNSDLNQPYVAEPSFHVATIDWHASRPGSGDISASSMVRTRPFRAICTYVGTICSPRQARDKHRKKLRKQVVSAGVGLLGRRPEEDCLAHRAKPLHGRLLPRLLSPRWEGLRAAAVPVRRQRVVRFPVRDLRARQGRPCQDQEGAGHVAPDPAPVLPPGRGSSDYGVADAGRGFGGRPARKGDDEYLGDHPPHSSAPQPDSSLRLVNAPDAHPQGHRDRAG